MNKPTLATLKSFIKREFKNGNLYSMVKSSFDGMVDCVTPVNSDWKKAADLDLTKPNTLGISGLWLVGSSRDHITDYADSDFIGYQVSNSCGVSIVAMKRLY